MLITIALRVERHGEFPLATHAEEMLELAERLQIPVVCEINGRDMSAYPGYNITNVIDSWR